MIAPFTPQLDDMLTREQAAKWLQISEEQLAIMSNGLTPRIPAFKPSKKFIRYHPRTIIAVLAKRAGIADATVTASFGTIIQQP